MSFHCSAEFTHISCSAGKWVKQSPACMIDQSTNMETFAYNFVDSCRQDGKDVCELVSNFNKNRKHGYIAITSLIGCLCIDINLRPDGFISLKRE